MKVYEKVYDYYLNQMHEGKLRNGDKMPSLRSCMDTLSVSKTSAETAYMQLADDGYIYSIEKKGFFVTKLAAKEAASHKGKQDMVKPASNMAGPVLYDFATIGEDKSVSCLDLWRRYMKSALRQEDRLLSYASSQGEADLREAIADYVRKSRNIICSPDDIVIGSGFQSLLTILISLIHGQKSISFPTHDYADAAAIFSAAGFNVDYRNKNQHIIYVLPSYMTKWGEVMTIKRRHELIEHAVNNKHLIIEDDYQNEFVFSGKPNPSLYAMTGGENVAFLGSFSRILLPSVRISYLILPKGYGKSYELVRDKYNQTASKAEQIALCQFLRDGHLRRHVKKMRHLYEEKRLLLATGLTRLCGERDAILLSGDSGMEMAVALPDQDAKKILADKSIKVTMLGEKDGYQRLLFSCAGLKMETIQKGLGHLQYILSK